MLAELMKTFPESGQLCSEVNVPDTNRKIFNDLLTDLKKALKKSSVLLSEGSRKEHYVLPLECHYLNKNAFMSVVGHQPQAIKYFTLRFILGYRMRFFYFKTNCGIYLYHL